MQQESSTVLHGMLHGNNLWRGHFAVLKGMAFLTLQHQLKDSLSNAKGISAISISYSAQASE